MANLFRSSSSRSGPSSPTMRAAAATPRPTGRSGARDKRSEAYLQRRPQRRGLPASSSSSSSRGEKMKLPHKYYQLIANDDEKTEANSLRKIRKDRLRLIRYRKPPGYKTRDFKRDPKDPKFPEIMDFGRKIFKALTAFVRTMHENHLTLNGNIKARMMLWIASSRLIKLRNVSPNDFSELTTDGKKKDYDAIADLIENDLLRGFELPEDMKDWVKLLRDNPKNMYLVRYHVALMAPEDKVQCFVKLYNRLLQEKQKLKLGHKNKYNAVVGNIPAGDMVWMTDVGRNKYVEKVFTYKIKGYRDTADDLLRFVRNCTQHIMKHSVGVNKNKFEDKDVYCMIESCFSGLFHKFQRAMVNVGL